MTKIKIYAALLLAVVSLAIYGFSAEQSQTLDAKSLKQMLTELGYTLKDLNTEPGKEKYSTDIATPSLNIPIGIELSPSKNYVWLTVFLAQAQTTADAKTLEMLKQNGKIQPSFFYITSKDNLMMALAVENRGITNAVLKARIETLTTNVQNTKDVWQKN